MALSTEIVKKYLKFHMKQSVQFSSSVVSDSLRPHEPQHARHPCASPTPGVYSNSCLSSLILCRPLLLPPSIFPSIRKKKWKSHSHVWLFEISQTVASLAPLSVAFSRQEYWSGLPFLLQEISPTQGSNLGLLHCKQILYHWATGEAHFM